MASPVHRHKWVASLTLPLAEKAILRVLADHADSDSLTCWPSMITIARESGASERTTHRVIARLANGKIIDLLPSKGRKPNRYRLRIPNPVREAPLNPVTQTGFENPNPVTVTPLPCHGGTVNPVTMTPEPDHITRSKNHTLSVLNNGHECFDQFWKRYPRKEGKKRALEVWMRKKLESREKATPIIVDVVKRTRDHKPWIDGFVPHASTYLNGERWEDDISPKNE